MKEELGYLTIAVVSLAAIALSMANAMPL